MVRLLPHSHGAQHYLPRRLRDKLIRADSREMSGETSAEQRRPSCADQGPELNGGPTTQGGLPRSPGEELTIEGAVVDDSDEVTDCLCGAPPLPGNCQRHGLDVEGLGTAVPGRVLLAPAAPDRVIGPAEGIGPKDSFPGAGF
jgi:hypothetical protein